MAWSDFPSGHKVNLYRGVLGYAVTVALLGGWIWAGAQEARKAWQERIPQTQAAVQTVYLTPQITETHDVGEDAFANLPIEGTGSVSIVMTGLGLSDDLTERAIDDLPGPIALAFSAYSPDIGRWVAQAGKKKRASLILLPMEPASYPKDDPGPQALLTRLSVEENARTLNRMLSQASGVLGAMNFMGSSFLRDERDMIAVFKTLKRRGAMFIEDAGDNGKPQAAEAASLTGTPYLAATTVIDASAEEIDIRQQLLQLEKSAREKGYAIALATPYPVTFNILKSWAEGLDRRGIHLVSPDELWKIKTRLDAAAEKQERQE